MIMDLGPEDARPVDMFGCHFRSRLEARWAAFFTELGYQWRYEPWYGDGYLPDFVVEQQRPRPLLVEVKPAQTFQELLPHVVKTINGVYRHWPHQVAMVGAQPAVTLLATPDHTPFTTLNQGLIKSENKIAPWRTLIQEAATEGVTARWSPQERYCYGDARFNGCRHCSCIGLSYLDGWNGDELTSCGHCCADVVRDQEAISEHWARAVNVVRTHVECEEMAGLRRSLGWTVEWGGHA